ncbi:hypothetical protein C8J57DRAFT_1313798 [Mycena rebaudengoi]|nr:hypothetical protein C8J57DRAFT_1313798 [Mycena rebaudengoi]
MSTPQTSPTEILLKIFDFAVGDDPLLLGGTAVAVPISQVCQDWRRIALDSPTLWDDIRFPRCGAYCLNQTMLDDFMARSASLPLTVVFGSHFSGRTLEMCMRFFERMKYYCRRFQKMYAMLPREDLFSLNASLGRAPFPSLIHLHVVQLGGAVAANVKLEKAPLLAVIHVQKALYMYSDRRPLAGSNLRSLRAIELPRLQLPGPILQTDLEELVIIRTPLPSYPHPPGNYVVQLNLTSLTLDDLPASLSQTGKGLRHFFRSFSMKRLARLEVARLDERGSAELMTAIGAPVRFPSLLSLTLRSLTLVGITPEFCLTMPALESIALVDVNPEPLRLLLHGNPSIFPTPQSLSIDGVDCPIRGG